MIRKAYVEQKEWRNEKIVAPVLWGRKSYGKAPKQLPDSTVFDECYDPVRIPVAVMGWAEYERLVGKK
jgi:hypothetical protein